MTSIYWSTEKIFHLIDLYREREVLWNPKHPSYFNKCTKNDAWKELAVKLKDITEGECRKKINILLSGLRREKARILRSYEDTSGNEKTYESNWFAFESLQFILTKDEKAASRNQALDKGIGKVVEKVTEKSKANSSDHVDDNSINTLQRLRIQNRKRKLHDQLAPLTGHKRQHDINDNFESSDSILQQGLCEPIKPRVTLQPSIAVTRSMLVNKKHQEDECRIFLNFIHMKMKRYTPITQSAVQHAIMNILYSADTGYYDQISTPVNPPNIEISNVLTQFVDVNSSLSTNLNGDGNRDSTNLGDDFSTIETNPLSPLSHYSESEDIDVKQIL